jgi:predicted RNA-binding Zn ribbon-like protein
MSFVFVSGRPALDFAGTLKWREDDPEEQLRTPGDLPRWIVAAGLTPNPPPVNAAAFERAIGLREAIYCAVTACMAERRLRPTDVAQLNQRAAELPLTPVLTSTGRLRHQPDVDAVLSTLARDAIDVIGGPDADRLRRCADERCTRVYVDASRGRNRRWCGMTECGNAAKVAAFRARRRD